MLAGPALSTGDEEVFQEVVKTFTITFTKTSQLKFEEILKSAFLIEELEK